MKNGGIILGAIAAIGIGAYFIFRKDTGTSLVKSGFTTGSASAPNRYGLGGAPIGTPVINMNSGGSALAALGVAGINTLGALAGAWVNRKREPSQSTTGAGRVFVDDYPKRTGNMTGEVSSPGARDAYDVQDAKPVSVDDDFGGVAYV